MSELLDTPTKLKPGFRLQRLEIYNWGTFDSVGPDTRGEVYRIETNGDTALLIGRNGSGKSTLVDAVLTLLVRPSVRNYNVAAGAKKRERDERSYIRGAYDRRSSDQDGSAQVQYLRPGHGHYSVLLACFHNADRGASFTIAQVLYMTADGRAERIYCFDKAQRTIAGACSGLNKADMLQQLKKRGFRATRSYTEYYQWFLKATGVRRKAMDMLNQTVAVKDIHRLNAFIRDHMLEARNWGQTVDSLLTHFGQLSEAHQSLVRVRDQLRLLEPIEKYGRRWQDQTQQLKEAEQLLAATDAFFHQQIVDLFTPEIERQQFDLQQVRDRKEELAQQIAETQDIIRRIENEMDHQGGDRLKEIPRLIALERKDADNKHAAHERLLTALEQAGVPAEISGQSDFDRLRQQLPRLKADVDQKHDRLSRDRDEQVVRTAATRGRLEDLQDELAALDQRRTNLPRHFVEVRRRLCESLRISARDLPFAAELMSVDPAERRWEASIEMVLRSFALSLLVPDRLYQQVSSYVNQNRLQDDRGFGQKLVYLRVSDRQRRLDGSVLDPDSLVRKLKLREDHALLPWVRTELEERFDYRCCESVEDFQSVYGPAITAECHLRNRNHHFKDDRDRVADPSHYVLGWDNQEKKQRLRKSIEALQSELESMERQQKQLEQSLRTLRTCRSAIDTALSCSRYADIDYLTHQMAITRLEEERRQLEAGNDTVRLLKEKRNEHRRHVQQLTDERDRIGIREGELNRDQQEARSLLENAKRQLNALREKELWPDYEATFPRLDDRLQKHRVSLQNFREHEKLFRRERERECEQLRRQVRPLQEKLLERMSRFLAKFPEEKTELHPSTDYLTSFMGLLESIREDDLPRHEQRFKERLNDKVTREIGLLNSELERERYAIEDKIDLLNQALMQLEYRPGTHMKLEARPVHDREIREFRTELQSCLEDSYAADEARFIQIEKLIHRLRDEERWRTKVTDVRRWFDFAAREIDDATGEERSFYEDSTGQSGGEKAKLAFTILVAAIAYQYDIEPGAETSDRFHFVVVDEMFSKIDDQYSEYALELFRKFGLQLLIVAPLDAKARVTERYVGAYLLVAKDEHSHSRIHSMTAREFEDYTDSQPDRIRQLSKAKPK